MPNRSHFPEAHSLSKDVGLFSQVGLYRAAYASLYCASNRDFPRTPQLEIRDEIYGLEQTNMHARRHRRRCKQELYQFMILRPLESCLARPFPEMNIQHLGAITLTNSKLRDASMSHS